ncbi:pyridoxal-dependent decarboxylase, exosortase A system-associated [Alteriqipengyuania lutimaris]|uniref:Pyridoxal-dependent decarboxylase, exosortase A system-associated n=1 Tax=Alteriqipengyuania lutimaris TaxID=1538146 RepID=A0A395LRK7_9SPHN|nr:pyridoxal-dependent decarboxylase, exosortase A system-associated [Alteriqipengyuania lutimaris]MBB3032751.1 diaminopimelate decarboxylase [Alteriqipengyuania lutimaris]RDS78144.1 pyridoxal-dependent decarboxylase, exosortase A system-associated [Alteriqipengyuania lutimaris]
MSRRDANAPKPLGPIPAGFETLDGELAIGGRKVSDLVDEAGDTPLFVYSRAMLDARMAALRAAMPESLAIHYAVKANPHPDVIAHMAGLVDGFDLASGGELAILQGVGIDGTHISFAGPGKRPREIRAAIEAGVTLNCESETEGARALEIGRELGVRPKIAVRVNPDFDMRGSGMKMGGGAKQFGLDAQRVPALIATLIEGGAEWRGLHIYTGSQTLEADAVIETQGHVLDLAARIAREVGRACPALNLGGGFGIPYFAGNEPLDIAAVGAALGERLANLPDELAETEMAIELGRYLVGEAGVYLTQIVDRKESHGEIFLITDGGLHHQLAASGNFGAVVRRNYPLAIATRYGEQPTEIANVVGCLCTPLDRLSDKAELPRAEVGDLVAVFCAGAYGASASPMHFLGQGPAIEMLV